MEVSGKNGGVSPGAFTRQGILSAWVQIFKLGQICIYIHMKTRIQNFKTPVNMKKCMPIFKTGSKMKTASTWVKQLTKEAASQWAHGAYILGVFLSLGLNTDANLYMYFVHRHYSNQIYLCMYANFFSCFNFPLKFQGLQHSKLKRVIIKGWRWHEVLPRTRWLCLSNCFSYG